jgi:tRNA isopentenyl-2-thiomethyl-A-37 hydroxylase MiaE
MEWWWEYGTVSGDVQEVTDDMLAYTKQGSAYTKNADGTITTNLVFTNVPASAYKTGFAAKIHVKYKDKWGESHEVASGIDSRSVEQVASAIASSSAETDTAKAYADQIKQAAAQA